MRSPHKLKAWGSWSPVATAFHFGTKDASNASAEEVDAWDSAQLQLERTSPPPAPFKVPRGRGLPLPASTSRGGFTDVLLARRTWRGFGRKSLTRAQLGTLMDLTFGAQMQGRTQSGSPVLFKTSPSGGAIHSIEGYVLASRVAGVPKALYHYSPQTGRLHMVRRGASARQIESYIPGQWWFRDAAALVLMTAVLPRVRWRYPHPRAYRSVLFGAGHLCQTFCLVATWLKLAPFCTQALADSRIERDLGVDGVNEVLVYAAGVGTRPADGRWVQWPDHEPDHPYLPPRSARRR